jgi:ABC-type transport system substrate-binding protein
MVHVIGTTGCSKEEDWSIQKAGSAGARIVKSGNYSLGINMLLGLVKQAAKALPGYDIEVLEMHHNKKVDAPSGTALMLGRAAAEGRGVDLDQHSVRVREGHTGAREVGSIGFATLRGGGVVGEHSVILAGATERIDDYSAQFNLLEPNAYFPGALTGQLGYVSSPTWLAAALADPTLNQQPVGSGPFVFDSRSADSVTRFVRNEDWWNGDVYLDAIEFVPVPDADTRAELLVQGDINALQTSDPGAIQTLNEDPSIQQIKDETGEESFVMLNTGMAPFDDIRARQALTLATPEENYLNLIGLGDLRPASQRFIPESQYYNPDITMTMDDPAAAKALSDEYCADLPENCTDGKINMELQFPAGSVVLEQTGDLMVQGWGESFNVEIQTIPQDEHIQEAALGQYNAVLWRQFGAEDPALDNVWLLCRTVGGISLNWPKSCDPARDELLLAAQASTDQAERVELYKQAEQLIHDQYLYVFLAHTTWSNAFRIGAFR